MLAHRAGAGEAASTVCDSALSKIARQPGGQKSQAQGRLRLHQHSHPWQDSRKQRGAGSFPVGRSQRAVSCCAGPLNSATHSRRRSQADGPSFLPRCSRTLSITPTQLPLGPPPAWRLRLLPPLPPLPFLSLLALKHRLGHVHVAQQPEGRAVLQARVVQLLVQLHGVPAAAAGAGPAGACCCGAGGRVGARPTPLQG